MLEANPDHPGAIHLYIHLTEASTTPERAIPYAERLDKLMPAAGHLVHMGAHTFYRVGRFKDSKELNIAAVAADDRYFEKIDDTTSMWRHGYHVHNIHFVVVSAFMSGDKETAIAYAKRLTEAVSRQRAKNVGWVQLIMQAPYLMQAHLAAPQEVLALPDPETGSAENGEAGIRLPFVQAMWRYARGVAHARLGQLDEAEAEAEAIAALDARGGRYPDDISAAVGGVLQIAERVVRARIAEAREDWAAAIAHYSEAVERQDALPYLEPPYWYYPGAPVAWRSLFARWRSRRGGKNIREIARARAEQRLGALTACIKPSKPWAAKARRR